MRILGCLLALTFACLAVPAGAQDWRPIGEAEARLIVPPSAFGIVGIRRSVRETPLIRYERAAIPFDSSRRFFQFVLRESPLNVTIANPQTVTDIIASSLGAGAANAILAQAGQTMLPLGPTQYQFFTFAGFGCIGFITALDGTVGGYPANAVEGTYCDPATPLLPAYDAQRTLSSIQVLPPPRR